MYIFLPFIFGCHTKNMETEKDVPSEHPIAEKQDATAVVPVNSSREEMIRLFSMRDRGPDCHDLALDEKTGLDNLIFIIENIKYPGVAGMRAAECVVQLYPSTAQNVFVSWMQGENTKGLALLLSSRLNDLPPDVAAVIKEAGLKGPHKAEISNRIKE